MLVMVDSHLKYDVFHKISIQEKRMVDCVKKRLIVSNLQAVQM